MKLIVNADDFGISRGANYGIIDAYKNGVVRSTSIMAGMPAFDHAIELLKSCDGLEGLGCGVHLTLSANKPVLDTHKTIVDENGEKILEELIKKANPDKAYFVIGHHVQGYEKAVIDICKKLGKTNKVISRKRPSDAPFVMIQSIIRRDCVSQIKIMRLIRIVIKPSNVWRKIYLSIIFIHFSFWVLYAKG